MISALRYKRRLFLHSVYQKNHDKVFSALWTSLAVFTNVGRPSLMRFRILCIFIAAILVGGFVSRKSRYHYCQSLLMQHIPVRVEAPLSSPTPIAILGRWSKERPGWCILRQIRI